MNDKKSVIPLSVDAIKDYIFEDASLRDVVLDFVQQLENHGILKMFMVGNKFDELTSKLNSLGILTGPFAGLDYRGDMILGYYQVHFGHQIAKQIAAAQVTTKDEIAIRLDCVIELWQTPKHASDLFLAVCDFAVRVRKVYQAAIDSYFKQKVETGLRIGYRSDNTEKVLNYWEEMSKSKKEIFSLLDAALPLGIESSEETEIWILNHRDEFDRIDFDAATKLTDFETVFEIFFGNTRVTSSGIKKSDAKVMVYQSYKALVLKDCLTEVKDAEAQTGENLTSVLQAKANDDALRLIIRFIQAGFMFYREDARLIRERTRRSVIESMPTLYNGGTINIPN